MQFTVQIIVEAENVGEAIMPEKLSSGTVVSVNPRPQPIQQPIRPLIPGMTLKS